MEELRLTLQPQQERSHEPEKLLILTLEREKMNENAAAAKVEAVMEQQQHLRKKTILSQDLLQRQQQFHEYQTSIFLQEKQQQVPCVEGSVVDVWMCCCLYVCVCVVLVCGRAA